jgi:hypothetical protein
MMIGISCEEATDKGKTGRRKLWSQSHRRESKYKYSHLAGSLQDAARHGASCLSGQLSDPRKADVLNREVDMRSAQYQHLGGTVEA